MTVGLSGALGDSTSPPAPSPMQRDKVNLDIFWLKDEGLEDLENLPDPEVLAGEIVENLRVALEEFEGILGELGE